MRGLASTLVDVKNARTGIDAGWRGRLGVAPATSPDARYGHPALRSLGGVCALALRASLATYAGSRGRGNPELSHVPLHAAAAGRAARCGSGSGSVPLKPEA